MLYMPPEQMEWMIGQYLSDIGLGIKLFEEKGVLQGQVIGQNPFTLYAKSDSVLFNPVIGLNLSFHHNNQGPVSFTFRQNRQELVFTKTEKK